MKSKILRGLIVMGTVVNVAGFPLLLSGCDKTESKSKTTTTTTRETPAGTQKTTESTEKKVENNPK